MKSKLFSLNLLAAACLLGLVLLVVPRGYTQPDQAEPTEAERLASIEAKLDALAAAVGDISGRSSIADVIERGFAEQERQMNDLQNDLRRIRDDVRRLERRH